jgi:hypothetical protein
LRRLAAKFEKYFVGTGKATERVSGWVVIASLGVVALAGVTLRVDGPSTPTRAERQIARRIEHVRRVERWRREVELKLREAPESAPFEER